MNSNKRYFICLSLFFVLVNFNSIAQTSAIPQSVRAVNTIERLTDSNGLGFNEMLFGIPIPPGKVVGDSYLNTNWKLSALLLYSGNRMIEGYPIRYDIAADVLDIKTSEGIKVIEGKKVKSFMWIDSLGNKPSYFINSKDFKRNNVQLIGFFEVLVDGDHPLLKKTNLTIKKADYNPALSIGSRDDKVLQKHEFYIASGNAVTEIPGSTRKLKITFGDKARVMEAYIDSANLSLKREPDLIRIVKYYNELK